MVDDAHRLVGAPGESSASEKARGSIAFHAAIMSSPRAFELGPCTELQRSPTREPATRSVVREGIPERPPGRSRAAGRADHVDEGAKRGRDLPMPGIVEEESLDRRGPVLQHPDQLSRAQERFGESLNRVCNT